MEWMDGWMGPQVVNFKMEKMDLTINPHMVEGGMDRRLTTII